MPSWLPNDVALPANLAGDMTVWRAAHGIPDSDRRPTGPRQADFEVRQHQTSLDQRVSRHLDGQGATWLKPITEIVGRRDAHTPVLAERLADLAQQGHDVHRLLANAADQGHLPDDHATAALDSRITRIVENRAAEDSQQRRLASEPSPRMGPSRSGPSIGF